MVEDWSEKIQGEVGPPWFILIQDGVVLDVSSRPGGLMWCLLEADSSFKVAVGVLNEFGLKEIAGLCAEYTHDVGNRWYLSSPMDGHMRMVGITGTPDECILQRLATLNRQGRFNDPLRMEFVDLICSH